MKEFITKDQWEHKQFSTGMMRDTNKGKPRFDLVHPLGIPYEEQRFTRLAKLLGRWAEKYSERNWEKAETPAELDRFMESAQRHFHQRYFWEKDEDHMAAVIFNMIGAEMVKYKMSFIF